MKGLLSGSIFLAALCAAMPAPPPTAPGPKAIHVQVASSAGDLIVAMPIQTTMDTLVHVSLDLGATWLDPVPLWMLYGYGGGRADGGGAFASVTFCATKLVRAPDPPGIYGQGYYLSTAEFTVSSTGNYDDVGSAAAEVAGSLAELAAEGWSPVKCDD